MDLLLWYISNFFANVHLFTYYGIHLVSSQQFPEEDLEVLKDYKIYYSYNRTREVLMRYYNRSSHIKTLIDDYDFKCSNGRAFLPKKHAFITIEGAYRRTRNFVAQRIAKKVNARVVGCPPQFMTMSNYIYNDTMELRRAFYSLAVHASACRAREFLSIAPVVIAGYWVDQAAFGVAKMCDVLPPESSKLYEWPDEILKPDRVYLINPKSNFPPIPLHPFKPMRQFTFKDKLLEAMLLFRKPSLTEINTTTNYDDIVRVIIHFINKHFNTTYDVY